MNNKPIVFVTQGSSKLDLDPARRYGTIEYLTHAEYQPMPTDGVCNENIVTEFQGKLSEYRPGTDFILLSGSPASIFLAGMLIGEVISGDHKILKWNSRLGDYEVCLVPSTDFCYDDETETQDGENQRT